MLRPADKLDNNRHATPAGNLSMALQTCSHHMRQSRMPCLWAAVPAHSRGKKLPPLRPVVRARNKAKAPAGHDTPGVGCLN